MPYLAMGPDIFTDGARKEFLTDRQRIFGCRPSEVVTLEMSSGGLAILDGFLINLFVVTHYDNLIFKSSPYEPEAIAIIGAFYSLGPSIGYGYIYTDCKSLVDKLNPFPTHYSTVYSSDIWVSTICQLQKLFSVQIAWIQSHPEDRKPRIKWTYYDFGNYYADLMTRGDAEPVTEHYSSTLNTSLIRFSSLLPLITDLNTYFFQQNRIPLSDYQSNKMIHDH